MGANTYGYGYDAIGNRWQSAVAVGSGDSDVTGYCANRLNQYSNITYQSNSLQPNSLSPSYDADGNMLSNGDWHYTWDAENRLVVASNATTVVRNTYDHQSRRILKEVSTYNASTGNYEPVTSNLFLYDGWNPIREIVQLDALNSLTNYYTWGLDLSGSLQGAGGVGGLLAVTRVSSSTSNLLPLAYYPLYDANGNVTAYLDSTGTPAAAFEYDAFGNTVSETVSAGLHLPFRFSTKYLDGETGMYYYGYRFDIPRLGRWASRDLIGEEGGYNLYGMVNNSPISKIDELGLWPSKPGFDDHTPFTQQAVDSISSRLKIPSKAIDKMKVILVKGNLSVDSGTYFSNNYWHFNKNIEDLVDYGKQQYSTIIYDNYVDFYLNLLNSQGNDKVCQSELERLGRLSHAWQDYYAHAVSQTYIGGSASGSEPAVGSINKSSDPYHIDPHMKPSSYDSSTGGEHGKVRLGVNIKNGMYEPGNRAPDRDWRRATSVSFTASQFVDMIQYWYSECGCTKTAKGWK